MESDFETNLKKLKEYIQKIAQFRTKEDFEYSDVIVKGISEMGIIEKAIHRKLPGDQFSLLTKTLSESQLIEAYTRIVNLKIENKILLQEHNNIGSLFLLVIFMLLFATTSNENFSRQFIEKGGLDNSLKDLGTGEYLSQIKKENFESDKSTTNLVILFTIVVLFNILTNESICCKMSEELHQFKLFTRLKPYAISTYAFSSDRYDIWRATWLFKCTWKPTRKKGN